MDEYLKLNDETVLKDSRAVESVDGLFLSIKDSDYGIVDVFNKLADPSKTKKITFHYYKVELVFDWYTQIVAIQDEGSLISAVLKKGKVGTVNGED